MPLLHRGQVKGKGDCRVSVLERGVGLLGKAADGEAAGSAVRQEVGGRYVAREQRPPHAGHTN